MSLGEKRRIGRDMLRRLVSIYGGGGGTMILGGSWEGDHLYEVRLMIIIYISAD